MDIFIFGCINNTVHFMLVIEIDIYSRKFHQKMAKHYDSFLQPVSTIFKLPIDRTIFLKKIHMKYIKNRNI